MSEIFLQLEAQEQSQIYRAFSAELSRSPAVLEKDVWVCWVLQTLFTMPASLPMAFKGGTSLFSRQRIVTGAHFLGEGHTDTFRILERDISPLC